ncbi:MAG: efflux RND transporter periplasmic adaptor subunit [Candidatus Omnitrophica bacterium]|nr:efflux RND transporter periplasmic adaptor subunit [Candidatus Omnitrophota bacterium]MCB9720016.1 efflux RND transporter periplasmic adaptor subunit [Candidatus Omnitrophota bacterium]
MRKEYAGVIIAAVLISGCVQPEPPQEVIRPVRVERVYKTDGARVRTFSGVASAGVESKLSFKVGGTVEKKMVNVGDLVRQGDLIAQLDPQDFSLQAQEVEAQIAQAEAQARNTKSNYERVRALYENNNASKSDLDQARAAYESSQASLQALANTRELAQRQIGYTKLRAPRDGHIASVEIDVNENVGPGQTIVVLTSDEDIDVEVMVPENLITRVRKGDIVEVSFVARPDRIYQGQVTEVGVSSGSFATTYPVTVNVASATGDVRSGMAAEVAFHFVDKGSRDHWVVRSSAVNEDAQGRFVYIAEPAEGEAGMATVTRRDVSVGSLTDDGIEILSGLRDGDRVITAGVSKVQPDQKVRLLQ